MTTFWGKLAKSPATPSIHPLADHSLDVAVVFRALCQNTASGRRFLALAGVESQESGDIWIDRFATLALLHDLGKCNWGFQAKRFDGARETTGHSIEAAAFLLLYQVQSRWPSEWREYVRAASSWFVETESALFALLLASFSHHGKPISFYDVNAAMRPDRWWRPNRMPDGAMLDPMRGISELVIAAGREFPRGFDGSARAISASPPVQQRFAGLLMLADWIASDTLFFPFRASPEENRRELAEQAAERALLNIGLRTPRLKSLPAFNDCFDFEPTPLQCAVDELPISDAQRILLIESETGSGKTEAALRWFFRLFQAGAADGLYFALPTRVAARELYERVWRSVQTVFPDAQRRPSPVLLAVPGYAKADGERILPKTQNAIWDDQADAAERVWAAERPKRFLAAPIAVGTVDQAMLSVLKVKHALMRSVCLDRHLLVIDEVHASDTYMREIIATLVEQHVRRGGWVLMLSATLGESARARFFGREAMTLDCARLRPYPAITTRDRDISIPSSGREKQIRIESLSHEDRAALFDAVNTGLRSGARILIVCNTVSGAIELQREIEQTVSDSSYLFSCNGTICPHHGRFARADREHLDAAVTARFGKNSAPGPVLLIGTQTLEQSLDIDADLLITDLAPMDVLLQRIGRLHRHLRARPPGFETPSVLVRTPSKPLEDNFAHDGKLKGPAGWGTVYVNVLALELTLNELRARAAIVIPRDNRELIERVTHPDAFVQLPDVWQVHRNWLEGKFLDEWRAASTSLLYEAPFGELHYDNDGRKIMTRLDAGSVCIRLSPVMTGPFGSVIDELIVPFRWLGDAVMPESVGVVPLADAPGFRFAIGDRQFIYTRFGLERAKP